MLLLGGGLLSVFLLSYFPGLQGMSQVIASALLQFLATFGSGSSFRGLVVIGLTCSLVGALFDTYAFYRYQNLRGEWESRGNGEIVEMGDKGEKNSIPSA